METSELRMGLVGCGRAARIHAERLRLLPGTSVVGCADTNPGAARALASSLGPQTTVFPDLKALISDARPDAVAIFTPQRTHFPLVMDALQAGCHVFVERPLTTNLQEAHDIVYLARARGLQVGVGHQYRLCPSLLEARRWLQNDVIGRPRLVTAVLTQPWVEMHSTLGDSWRLDPRVSGGGALADIGGHLIDTILWLTGRSATEVSAFQDRVEPGLDLVTAASVRLEDQVQAILGVSGVAPGALFEVVIHGDKGRLRATDSALWTSIGDAPEEEAELAGSAENIDSNFVDALLRDVPLCCPAEEAVETVRLLEALVRSATTGRVVRVNG